MKPRKSPKADLEKHKGLFFQIGLFASLLATILFFMWSQPVISVEALDFTSYSGEIEELPDITRQEPEPLKPQHIAVHTFIESFNIRPDDVLIEYNPEFGSEFDGPIDFQPLEVGKGMMEALDPDPIDFMLIEDKPLFRGQDASTFRSWVMKELVYPVVAAENGISGRVFLQFIIDREGNLTEIEVLASPDRSLSEEAIRILRRSEKWTPGKQRGRPVPVRFNFSVDFKLQN